MFTLDLLQPLDGVGVWVGVDDLVVRRAQEDEVVEPVAVDEGKAAVGEGAAVAGGGRGV